MFYFGATGKRQRNLIFHINGICVNEGFFVKILYLPNDPLLLFEIYGNKCFVSYKREGNRTTESFLVALCTY